MSRFIGSVIGLVVAVTTVALVQWLTEVKLSWSSGLMVGLFCGWLGYLVGWMLEVRRVRSE